MSKSIMSISRVQQFMETGKLPKGSKGGGKLLTAALAKELWTVFVTQGTKLSIYEIAKMIHKQSPGLTITETVARGYISRVRRIFEEDGKVIICKDGLYSVANKEEAANFFAGLTKRCVINSNRVFTLWNGGAIDKGLAKLALIKKFRNNPAKKELIRNLSRFVTVTRLIEGR